MRTAAVILASLLALPLLACRTERFPDPTRDRPNILLIVADDLGYSDLGCYGGEIPTPHLDGLAERGLVSNDFYVAPRGAPTRAMLMTGVDNHFAGFGTTRRKLAPNQEGMPGYEGRLSPRVVTVASLLRKGGYHTVMAGKWELGEEPENMPSARGFERSFVLHDSAASYWSDMVSAVPGRDRAHYTHNGAVVTELPEDYYSSRYFSDFVIDSIEEHHPDGRPFFAYLSFQAPHGPFGVPEDWRDRAKGRYDKGFDAVRERRLVRMKMAKLVKQEVQPYPGIPTVPSWGDLPDGQRERQVRKMEIYAALVENMDFHVGRVLDYLKEKEELRNTLVVFLSDNGAEPANRGPNGMDPRDREWYAEKFPVTDMEAWGGPGSFVEYGPAWAQVGTVPFRLFKGTSAEGGIRAPLIVSGWGVGRNNPLGRRTRIEDGILHVMDVPASLLDVAAVEYPASFAGRSLIPMEGVSALQVPDSLFGQRSSHEWLAFEFAGDRALRRGRWKLVQMSPPFGSGKWRLYRIDRDPSEIQDLADSRPEVRDELKELWEQYARAHGVVVPKDEPDEPEAVAEPAELR